MEYANKSLALKRVQEICPECLQKSRHKLSCGSYYKVPSFVNVGPRLYVGCFEGRYNENWGAIVTILTERELQRLERRSIQGLPVLHVDHEDEEPGITQHFDRVFEFINEHRKGKNVYVHCRAGISRSPFAVATYLTTVNNYNYDQNLSFLRRRRKVTSIWPEFIEEGRKYLRYLEAGRPGEYIAPQKSGW